MSAGASLVYNSSALARLSGGNVICRASVLYPPLHAHRVHVSPGVARSGLARSVRAHLLNADVCSTWCCTNDASGRPFCMCASGMVSRGTMLLPNGRSDSSLALSEVTQFPRRSDDVFVEVSAEGRGGPVSHKAAAALDVSATTVSIDTASPGRGTVDGSCTKPTRTQRAAASTAELAAAVARSPSEQEASLLPPLSSPGEAEPVALNRSQVCRRGVSDFEAWVIV